VGRVGYLCSGGFNVNVLADNGCVFSSTDIVSLSCNKGIKHVQLKSNPLQGLARTLHNLLARRRRTRETDLLNKRVRCEPRTQVIITAQRLHNTGREEVLRELNELQTRVGREGRGLDDDGVTSQHGGRELLDGERDGEVPGDDADGDTDGGVADDDLALGVVLHDLVFDLGGNVGGLAEHLDRQAGFKGCDVHLKLFSCVTV
jgi:hypothetical protein